MCACAGGGEEDVYGANIYTLVLTGTMGDRPCGDLFQFLRLNLPSVDQVRQVQLQQFRVECIPLLSGMEQGQCRDKRKCEMELGHCGMEQGQWDGMGTVWNGTGTVGIRNSFRWNRDSVRWNRNSVGWNRYTA